MRLFYHKMLIISVLILFFTFVAFGQSYRLQGNITSDDLPIHFATVEIVSLGVGTTTNESGDFVLAQLPKGDYDLVVAYLGYEDQVISVSIPRDASTPLAIEMTKKNIFIDEVVVTGSKTFKRRTDAPVVVGVVDSKTLDGVQACNLSDGLKFQPGLRVETDCQTCNYTQLRMNGLAGGYSQVLINGRPIFSPLMGLYGMEQLPVNMIDRIEVVRGAGSSLYGSSAIGGTVNVITKLPKKSGYEASYLLQNINSQTCDHMFGANATLLSPAKKVGVSLFANHRRRDFYDHNDDGYSELPLLKNTTIGGHLSYQPTEDQKLELSLDHLYEYRFGGQQNLDIPAHLTEQAEERTHDVWMGSLDYQINLNDEQTSLITYAAWQQTDREHYTGILPDDAEELMTHIAHPPYGTSDATTINVGIQANQRQQQFLGGSNVWTLGLEYVHDDILDIIPAYRYLIDQTTKDLGAFVQSDWQILPSLTLLSGLRMDLHNLVDGAIWSPRLSLLYKYQDNLQFRLNYGAGFRAPQAFDADLHIAFAGGGISRVTLAPELRPEYSKSWSASINYDRPTDLYVVGCTVEGFRTKLDDAFLLEPIGEDAFGELFEKQNGQGATVQGVTLELRANYNRNIQLETGWTIQSSQFEEAVTYIDNVAGVRDFMRAPNQYGFANLSWTPSDRWSANLNYVYTGSMLVPHFAGAPNQLTDEITKSSPFSELSLKLSYAWPIFKTSHQLEVYGGVKNISNAYQVDFDMGKNRDSNFIYGPSQPRTFYIGVKWRG